MTRNKNTSERRFDNVSRMKHNPNIGALESSRIDMTKTKFEPLEIIQVGNVAHSLWAAKVHNGHEMFVACIGHPVNTPQYTRAFPDRAEALDFFAKFRGAV